MRDMAIYRSFYYRAYYVDKSDKNEKIGNIYKANAKKIADCILSYFKKDNYPTK